MKTVLVPNVAWPTTAPPSQPAKRSRAYEPRVRAQVYESCENAVRSYLRQYPGSTAAAVAKGIGTRYSLVVDHLRILTRHGLYIKRGKEYSLI